MGDLELRAAQIIIDYHKSRILNLRIIATILVLLALICVAFQVHWNFSVFACVIGVRDWLLG
jgi:hypothetical protein